MKENYFLAKWLNNEITESELKQYLSDDEVRSYKKIIAATKQLEAPNFNATKALENFKLLRSTPKVKKLTFTKYMYRVAAILVLTLTAYYFASNTNTNYTTNLAEKITFELPDNSKVNLNVDSKITYKPKRWNIFRELNLKGEAFFSVTKGKRFTVNTNLGSVSVLGTKFNVVVRDTYFEINCYEGLVSVKYQNQTIKLPAGSSFKVLNSTTKFTAKITEATPSWIQNKSTFKSMPYKYVIQELERQYNVKVTYNNKYQNNLFTGNFTHANLETALQAISVPFNLKFTIFSDNNVTLH